MALPPLPQITSAGDGPEAMADDLTVDGDSVRPSSLATEDPPVLDDEEEWSKSLRVDDDSIFSGAQWFGSGRTGISLFVASSGQNTLLKLILSMRSPLYCLAHSLLLTLLRGGGN